MIVLAALSAAIAIGISGLLRVAAIRSEMTGLRVQNYRGIDLPAVGGVVLVVTFLVWEAFLALISLIKPVSLEGDVTYSPAALPYTFVSADHLGFALIVFGFFALGAMDDLLGAGRAKGLKGHFSALAQGELTGGGIKAAGGLAIGFVCGAVWELDLTGALLDMALIALSANLVNLFDLRPGRAIKVFFLMWLPIAIVGWKTPYLPLSSVVAASAGAWLPADLKEKGMLGDGGANLLGAAAGAGFALVLPSSAKIAVAVALIVLTLISERVSFSTIIEKWAFLDKMDRLGRSRE